MSELVRATRCAKFDRTTSTWCTLGEANVDGSLIKFNTLNPMLLYKL